MSKAKHYLIWLLAFIFCGYTYAQDIEISGVVTSSTDGEPLMGVTVRVLNTTNGTITDLDGNYNLKVAPDASLEFSYMGFKNKKVLVNKQTTIDVVLAEDVNMLNEVIAVGYQTQRKADLTGAVSVVKVGDMMSTPDNNPMKALQGRVAGVNITSNGSPSGASTVRIRGIGTMNNNDPLYVIDGVPSKGGMHELNSNDIESIQVLRDASAASIYGSQAANGVIVITTKRGKDGQVKVNFDSYISTGKYDKMLKMMNTEQYGQALFTARVNSGYDPNTNNIGYLYDYGYNSNGNPVLNNIYVPKYVDSRDGTYLMPSSDTNWFDAITRNSFTQSYNLSVSSATKQGNYFFSMGYYDATGTIKESDFNRISARMNSSFNVLDGMVTIGENFTVNRTSELQAPGGILDLAIMSLPIMPVKKTDGDWSSVTSGMNDRDNPARVLNANKDNNYNYWRLFGNGYIEIRPIKDLTLRSSFGVDYSNYYQRSLTHSFTGRLGSDLTSSKMQQNQDTKWIWSNTATYDMTFGIHRLNLLGGYEMTKYKGINFSAEKTGFQIEDPDFMWPSAGAGDAYATGGATGFSLLSYFGKADYVFNEKYLASAVIRRDGSSRFGKDHRYGTFPAFSAGWRINQEDFMAKTKTYLSDLKLRVSWGQTGNQEIDNLANRTLIITNYGMGGAGFNDGTAYDISGSGSGQLSSGIQMTQRGNNNIKWETTTQTNIGVDFGFLNQSLYGSAEYYIKETKDILISPPYLGAIGEGGNRWVNGASMQNKGWEISLGYRGDTSFGLSYDIAGNISGYKNKITKLPEDVINSYGGNGTTDNILDRPINSYYGYIADGLFRTQDEVDFSATQTGKGLGRIRYKDVNGDGVIDENDRTWIGNPHPKFEYGLNINLAWNGFDLSAFFQGLYGNKVINEVKKYTDFWAVSELGMNKGTRLLGAWSVDNPNSDIPAIALTDDNNEKRFSSYYVEPGSYLKLRNLQIGYTLPAVLLTRIKMEKIRFYVSGQNLFTIKSKDFTGLDPENPGLAYPTSKTFTAGVNVTF